MISLFLWVMQTVAPYTSHCSYFFFYLSRWIKGTWMAYTLSNNLWNLWGLALSSQGKTYYSHGSQTCQYIIRWWYGTKDYGFWSSETWWQITNYECRPSLFRVSKNLENACLSNFSLCHSASNFFMFMLGILCSGIQVSWKNVS